MTQLPQGCYCSEMSVNPKNWQGKGASLSRHWYIQYYFHDPAYREHPKYKYGKLRIIKGMNRFSKLSERRDATRQLMEYEMQLLKYEGYNPITGNSTPEIEHEYEIEPSTPFIAALHKAKDKLGVEGSTLADMKSVLNGVSRAATRLHLANMPIGDIKRKHIKYILEDIGKHNSKFSGHTFNKYRSYLMSWFKELVEIEAVDSNPIHDISKRKITKRIRTTLSGEQRIMVDNYLKRRFYTFWRFMHIFFHSGARVNELLQVKVKDVDLARQKYKSVVKKGREYREVERTIKDMALPLWIETMGSASAEDYIFSAGLKPGAKNIRREQITRRWNVHVKAPVEKGGLGIKADFYSLKHSNTTEVVEQLSEQDAAAQNAHTSTAMVVNIYDVNRSDRQHERLKKVQNEFVKAQ